MTHLKLVRLLPQEKAEELFKIIDEDGSGELGFDEFCGFIVKVREEVCACTTCHNLTRNFAPKVKKGDPSLGHFASLLENIRSTPLGALERQVKARGLSMTFVTLEERPSTLSTAPAVVVELRIEGEWVTRT